MDPATLALILGGTTLSSSLLGWWGSNNAAETSANAQLQAAQLQYQAEQQALAQQQAQYGQARADMAPFLAMQQQAWQGYMGQLNNPQGIAGLDAMGALEHANTGAYFAKSGDFNSSASYAAQELVGQQLALQKAQLKLSAYSPLLNLGAPSQQSALASQFGQQASNTIIGGAQAQGGYLAGAGNTLGMGQMGGYNALAGGLGALGAYAGYQSGAGTALNPNNIQGSQLPYYGGGQWGSYIPAGGGPGGLGG
jgi:hypothetical protein